MTGNDVKASPTLRPNGTLSTPKPLKTHIIENKHGVSPDPGGSARNPRFALASGSGFPRRERLERQRVDASRKFRRQRRINHAVTLDPALPLERRRHNIDPEMRLAARPMAGMALMQM
jgi:hypothetical protein